MIWFNPNKKLVIPQKCGYVTSNNKFFDKESDAILEEEKYQQSLIEAKRDIAINDITRYIQNKLSKNDFIEYITTPHKLISRQNGEFLRIIITEIVNYLMFHPEVQAVFKTKYNHE